MIGQLKLQETVKSLIESDKFPRFCLLIGDRGSGKRFFIEHFIKKELGITTEMCSIDVESVRNTVEQSYTVISPTLYVFADVDNMSIAAKNAVLKVTEEPPNNAMFIMTAMNAENVLPTVRSRAFILYMDNYTNAEILEYCHQYTKDYSHDGVVSAYCQTPKDVELLYSYDVDKFKEFMSMVIDNIDKVSGANSFKIGMRLDLGSSSDESKYDLGLFWKAFRAVCTNSLRINPFKYIAGVNVTSKYLYDLRIAGVNKQMCFDNWLLDIRKEWMQYADDN